MLAMTNGGRVRSSKRASGRVSTVLQNAIAGDEMKRNKVAPTDFDIFIANISPLLEGLNDQVATLARLLSACREKIKDDSDLKDRMALIDELYSQADSEDHVAARFAAWVADRVYEYETETVLIPYSSQSQALAFLMDERGVKQKDLSAIATQSAISEILNDKRKMTVAQVKKFSEFFTVPAEFFMQGVV